MAFFYPSKVSKSLFMLALGLFFSGSMERNVPVTLRTRGLVVIGGPGSGKSTFSKVFSRFIALEKQRERTDVLLFNLDPGNDSKSLNEDEEIDFDIRSIVSLQVFVSPVLLLFTIHIV